MPTFGVVRQHQRIWLIRPELVLVYPANYSGVTHLRLVTTSHGRQLRGSPSIDDSLPNGVSAQAPIKTLSGWSGACRWWSVYPSGGRSGWG
ncbi:hypothetical protein [Lapidilactobacillus salsurivasis]